MAPAPLRSRGPATPQPAPAAGRPCPARTRVGWAGPRPPGVRDLSHARTHTHTLSPVAPQPLNSLLSVPAPASPALHQPAQSRIVRPSNPHRPATNPAPSGHPSRTSRPLPAPLTPSPHTVNPSIPHRQSRSSHRPYLGPSPSIPAPRAALPARSHSPPAAPPHLARPCGSRGGAAPAPRSAPAGWAGGPVRLGPARPGRVPAAGKERAWLHRERMERCLPAPSCRAAAGGCSARPGVGDEKEKRSSVPESAPWSEPPAPCGGKGQRSSQL